MKAKLAHVRRLSAAVSSRRGSMLIMVIVILVLLALIGTAMISTSRIDRAAVQQNAANVQIDLLLESVRNMVKAVVADDMYGTDATNNKVFRRGNGYYDFVAAGDPTATQGADGFLASRHPILTGGVTLQWPWLSQWMTNGTFESPATPFSALGPPPVTAGGQPVTYAKRQGMIPTFVTIGSGTYPALQDPATSLYYLAADADGDGIADSGLVRFPIGQINGVTYYYAVRILDNNSAINASTAWSGVADYTQSDGSGTPVPNHGFFLSNVGMAEMLASGDSIALYNRWRLGKQAGTVGVSTPVNDAGTSGTAVADFTYFTLGDEMDNLIAHRVNNPGWYTAGTRCNVLPLTESLSLAYKFVLRNVNASPSILESSTTGIPASVYNSVLTKPYTSVANWYNTNFNFGTGTMPMRSYLVARNGVQDWVASQDWTLLPPSYVTTAVPQTTNSIPVPAATYAGNEMLPKTSVNTASFNYLWRGFWNTMTVDGVNVPHAADITTGNAHMFNPSIRDPNAVAVTAADAFEQMMLRSALAAVNTVDLRNAGRYSNPATPTQEFITTSRQVVIYKADNTAHYTATVYGGQPQPYITEVYASSDKKGTDNPGGYVAIELYNPYPFDISMKNWQLASIDRISATNLTLKMTQITGFTGMKDATGAAPAVIKAGSYLVLENFNSAGAPTAPNDAKTRPAAALATLGTLAAPAVTCYVPNLGEVLWNATTSAPREFQILKPRRMILTGGMIGGKLENDALSAGTLATNTFDETANPVTDLVPADQFDFTGFPGPTADASYNEMHYVRENGPDHMWKWVYAGLYDPKASFGGYRQQGITAINVPVGAASDPWDPAGGTPPVPAIQLGLVDIASSYPNTVPPVQFANVDFAGPLPQKSSGNQYPLGGFARKGDMLEIPYIGSYRLVDTGGNLLELNAVTTDCGYAHAGSASNRLDQTNDAYEHIGRFVPMTGLGTPQFTASAVDYYDWGAKLFNYFATWTPADDYFPNVDPSPIDPGVTPAAAFTYRYPAGNGSYLSKLPAPPPTPIPYPVSNAGATAADSRDAALVIAKAENATPVEGMININTAPARVLGALPWLPIDPVTNAAMDRLKFDPVTGQMTLVSTTEPPTGDGVADNLQIGQLIAAWRDGTNGFVTPGGPFKSIADLNKVVATNGATFANAFGLLPQDLVNRPSLTYAKLGDITPSSVAAGDGVNGDFEKQCLMLTRVSNLITTRSDTFTVYVLVQGWQNVGTSSPSLAVQRRGAFLVDRTAMPTSPTPSTTNIPTD